MNTHVKIALCTTMTTNKPNAKSRIKSISPAKTFILPITSRL